MRWISALPLSLAILACSVSAQQEKVCNPCELRISPTVAEKNLIHRAEPVFPEDIKATGISGNAYINYVIDKHGNVVRVTPVPAPLNSPARSPKFIAAIVAAIQQWKFKPFLVGGNPQEVETYAVIDFDFSRYATTPNQTGIDWGRYNRPGVRLSMDVAATLLIHKMEPVYPSEARAKKLEGDVLLEVMIDQDGYTHVGGLIKGDPIFEAAAKDAVKQWRYKPYRLRGKEVTASTVVKVEFRLQTATNPNPQQTKD